MTTLKVNPLNLKSVNNAIQDIARYKESLKQFPNTFITELMKEFEKILEGQKPPLLSGMWNTYIIQKEDGSARGVVEFDGRVEFIEFGTGVVGKNNNQGINTEWLNKLPPPYLEYNKGPQITHFENENLDYWVYVDSNGNFKTTHGVKANPFIYRSVVELMEQYDKIAKNAFLGRS